MTTLDRLTAAMASSGETWYCAQLSRIERDYDGALIASEWRRGRDTGQRCEQRPHAVDGEILHLALRVSGAAEDQQADGHAACIETRDKGRHRAGRHEGSRAIHIAHRLRHRLAHVGAFDGTPAS